VLKCDGEQLYIGVFHFGIACMRGKYLGNGFRAEADKALQQWARIQDGAARFRCHEMKRVEIPFAPEVIGVFPRGVDGIENRPFPLIFPVE
jgi:hypothetical protein